jgi:Na+-driven multidrug efflux pump
MFYFQFEYHFAKNHQYLYKDTKIIGFNSVITSIANVLMNWALISILGIYGAALVTLLAQLISLIYGWCMARAHSTEERLFPFM